MIRRSSFDVRSDDRYADPARPTRARRLWQEEFTWLTARDRSHPFAFESVCEALAIEPSVLRGRVLAATAKLAGHSLTAPRGTMP